MAFVRLDQPDSRPSEQIIGLGCAIARMNGSKAFAAAQDVIKRGLTAAAQTETRRPYGWGLRSTDFRQVESPRRVVHRRIATDPDGSGAVRGSGEGYRVK